jgi:hypothetical protein
MELNDMVFLAAATLLSTDELQRPALAVKRAKELWDEVLKQYREN